MLQTVIELPRKCNVTKITFSCDGNLIRGACGMYPEHTGLSYRKVIDDDDDNCVAMIMMVNHRDALDGNQVRHGCE